MMQNSKVSKLLIESLKFSNLLCEQVGEFRAYDRNNFSQLDSNEVFNTEQKLGHLYEEVLFSLLKADPSISELKKSIQVFGKDAEQRKQTLGEFDFLYMQEDKLTQLELSVKFYMAVKQGSETFWYGPDPRDHWELKRKKMLNSQLLLKKLPESQPLMSALYGRQIEEVTHLVYGCVFDRLHEAPAPRNTISENAERGVWMQRSEVIEMFSKTSLFYIPKTLWPCPLHLDVKEHLTKLSCREVVERAEDRCVMFTNGTTKYFVVSDDWCESVNI